MDALVRNSQPVVAWLRHLKIRNLSPRTHDTYRRRVEPFLAWLDFRKLSFGDVDYHVLEDWIAHLREEEKKDRSVSISLSSIKSFWKWMRRERIVTGNPFEDLDPVHIEKSLPSFVGQQDVVKVIEAAEGARNRAILEMIYATGARRGEVHGMDVQDLHLDERPRVLIRKGKGRKERFELLTGPAVDALKAWLPERLALLERKAQTYERALWISRRGGRLCHDGVYKVVVKAGANAGLETYPHQLRHSIATHMLDNGANLREIQEFLGHDKIQSTQIYTHVSLRHLEETVRRTHPRAGPAGGQPTGPPRTEGGPSCGT